MSFGSAVEDGSNAASHKSVLEFHLSLDEIYENILRCKCERLCMTLRIPVE